MDHHGPPFDEERAVVFVLLLATQNGKSDQAANQANNAHKHATEVDHSGTVIYSGADRRQYDPNRTRRSEDEPSPEE